MQYIIVFNAFRVEENTTCCFKGYAVLFPIKFFFFHIPLKQKAANFRFDISQSSTSSDLLEKVEHITRYLLIISAIKTRSSVSEALAMACTSPSAQNVVVPGPISISVPLSL